MATEEGLPTPGQARRRIEVLRRRLDYLAGQETWNSYELAEIAALEWALPVLEAEWDYLSRCPSYYHTDVRREGSTRCPACLTKPRPT